MNVQQVYDRYNIPFHLQKHMLRVAALSIILVDNWTMDGLDKESIIRASAFHDMANIIKFNFDKPALFKEEESKTNYWRKIQMEVIKKYGDNIHKATLKMCQEIGLSHKTLTIIENLEWNNTPKILKRKDYESAISIYCDMRVGPYGIMPLSERIEDLETRNNVHNMSFVRKVANILETILQKYTAIQISEISDFQIKGAFRKLPELRI
ncbi:MAG: hypothetical protein V1922_04670 [bacterium]